MVTGRNVLVTAQVALSVVLLVISTEGTASADFRRHGASIQASAWITRSSSPLTRTSSATSNRHPPCDRRHTRLCYANGAETGCCFHRGWAGRNSSM
jgi:hypothetical protein